MKKLILALVLLLQVGCVYSQALYIFGGRGHDVFLGALNANKYESSSIWNAYGDYGSKYSRHSIWNKYGDYGSAYSDYSPFNKYASHPPVVVDQNGNFYGYFTINRFKNKRANFDIVNIIYEYHESIRNDVRSWYNKIFYN